MFTSKVVSKVMKTDWCQHLYLALGPENKSGLNSYKNTSGKRSFGAPFKIIGGGVMKTSAAAAPMSGKGELNNTLHERKDKVSSIVITLLQQRKSTAQ